MDAFNYQGISFFQIKGRNANGKILIFLPGIGAVKENYIIHLKSFISHYSFIYSIDLPEQGSKGFWGIGEMVENLKIFISSVDSSNIKSIHLAGHSAGAIAIISFIINYNKKVECKLSELNSIDDTINLIEDAKNLGFLKPIQETTKIEVLLLYSPPTSFSNNLTKIMVHLPIMEHQILFKFILNIFVNIPMVLLKIFTSDRFTNFNLEKSSKPQYYKYIMSNHKRFLSYTSDYETIFELFNDISYNLQPDISRLLIGKKILIQYGGFDWLLKFFLKRKKTLSDFYGISPNIEVVKHLWLGHFLRKKYRLDINLNNQMITNEAVIGKSQNYIKDK